MTVNVSLELKELQLQISGRPEQRPVETFAAYRADQTFDEWMRQRRVWHRLDGLYVEDSQIRLLLGNPIQRIMVRAEVSRRRLATNRSIEHLAARVPPFDVDDGGDDVLAGPLWAGFIGGFDENSRRYFRRTSARSPSNATSVDAHAHMTVLRSRLLVRPEPHHCATR